MKHLAILGLALMAACGGAAEEPLVPSDDPASFERLLPTNAAAVDLLVDLVGTDAIVGLPYTALEFACAPLDGLADPDTGVPTFVEFHAERLLAFDPDLVVVSPWQNADTVARLEESGVTVVVMPSVETLDDVRAGLVELGAVLGGRDEAVIAELGAIGLRMGVLYQLRDDVLGVFGDEAVTGKSVLSDIRAGAPTLLSALASRDPAWARVAHHYGDPTADEGAAARIRAVMRGSGALAEVERRIDAECAAVKELLDAAPIEESLRAELTTIVGRCAERGR